MKSSSSLFLFVLIYFFSTSVLLVKPYEVNDGFNAESDDSPLPYPIAISSEDIYNNLRGILGSVYSKYYRGLEGSNCIMIEHGDRTPYSYCKGCRIEEAVFCVEDMRYNRTRSVPPSCNMRGLLQKPEPQCCAQMDTTKNRIDRTTSAYPFAFSCLASVGCMDSTVAIALREECAQQCSDAESKLRSCNPYPDYSQAEEVICFPSSERVVHETRGEISIAEVKIGDSILSANRKGDTKFSQVIAFPHDVNNGKLAVFHELTLSDGSHVRMSPEHVLPVGPCHDKSSNDSDGEEELKRNTEFAREYPFVRAMDAEIGSCVHTHKNGPLPIVSNEQVRGEGVYSFVTNEELIVVGGIIVSPYAVSHNVANAYYTIFRWCFHHLGRELFTSINSIVSGLLTVVYPNLSQTIAFYKI